jgi:hypothetical protein
MLNIYCFSLSLGRVSAAINERKEVRYRAIYSY